MKLGPIEIGIIVLIILIVFGAGRLPQIGASLGKGIRAFKQESADPVEKPEPEPARKPRRKTAAKKKRAGTATGKAADTAENEKEEPVTSAG